LYQPDLAYQPNRDYSSPWPLENIKAALDELERHQALVIMDADATLPDTLSHATRNAAILDPTLDCIVRVPPGHVQSVIDSKILRFCHAYQAFPDTQSFDDFVAAMMSKYEAHYKGFVVLYEGTLLQYGMETARMRRAAIQAMRWQLWTEGVEMGTVKVIQSVAGS
jgi:hypothetical protein